MWPSNENPAKRGAAPARTIAPGRRRQKEKGLNYSFVITFSRYRIVGGKAVGEKIGLERAETDIRARRAHHLSATILFSVSLSLSAS